jgi:GT2 family glycosyltransferase
MTIIIPYLNNPTDLGVLLMQIQQQRQKPKAVFLADNSFDGSGFEIAKRYHFDESCPIAVKRNVGPIHRSWNEGIKFAQGDDVAIINDDVLLPWDFVDNFNEYLKSDAAQMYCPDNAGFPPVSRVRKGYEWYSKSQLGYRFLDHQEYVLPPSITGWCMVIPNKTIKYVGTFDENFKLYFGDKDYEARIFNAGGKVAFIKGINVQHYGSTSTLKREPKRINKFYAHDEAYYKQKYNLN